jgi:hypothetical protein
VDTLVAQNTFIGGGMTLSTYFGDLSPYTLKQSWTQIHPGFGFYTAKKIIDPIFIQVEFEQSTLTGMIRSKKTIREK